MLKLQSILLAECPADLPTLEVLRNARFLGVDDLLETLRGGADFIEGQPGYVRYLGEVERPLPSALHRTQIEHDDRGTV